MSRSGKKQKDPIKGKVSEWPASGLSQRLYCEQETIPFHTFKYWRQKQRALEKNDSEAFQSKSFVGLSLQTEPEQLISVPVPVELEYPNGVKLRIESLDATLLKPLITLY